MAFDKPTCIMCAWCKKHMDSTNHVYAFPFAHAHDEEQVSHGICIVCMQVHFPGVVLPR